MVRSTTGRFALGGFLFALLYLSSSFTTHITVDAHASPDGLPRSAEYPYVCPTKVSTLYRAHERMFEELSRAADDHITIPWLIYASDPEAYAGYRVEIGQAAFDEGTVRLTTPIYLAFVEDVVFDPNPNDDYRPRPDQPQYGSAAFRLDFFAAITVESPDVVIDGQGHSLMQSKAHRLQQRFYANIELADRPFISPQGPAGFGDLTGADRCVVTDIVLGRSSHHGIHGNDVRDVYLRNVDLQDYEVAAVALNGWQRVVQYQVRALGTSTDLPVAATYSHGRFLLPMVGMVLDLPSAGAHPAEKNALVAARDHLATVMGDVFDDVVTGGMLTVDPFNPAHAEAYALFANPTGFMDGNTYGFLYNTRGVAVNGFKCQPDAFDEDALNGLLVLDCEVYETRTRVNEVVALQQTAAGRTQKGAVGEVLRILSIIDPGTGAYVPGNALAETQIALAKLVRAMPPLPQPVGTLAIDDAVLDWTDGVPVDFRPLIGDGTYQYLRNGDAMSHVNKGANAMTVIGGHNVCVTDLFVVDTENAGARGVTDVLPGETPAIAYYSGAADGGHPAQDPQFGYMGADARGMALVATTNVYLNNVVIDRFTSDWAWARGLDIFNGATNTHARDVRISNGKTHVGMPPTPVDVLPTSTFTKVGSSIGLCISDESQMTFSRRRVSVDGSTMYSRNMIDQALVEAVVPQPSSAIRCGP